MRIRGVINRVGGEERRGRGPPLLYLPVLITWPPWRNNGGWELEAPQIRGLSASAQKQKSALLLKLLLPQEWLLTGFKDQGPSPSPYPYLPQNPDRNTKRKERKGKAELSLWTRGQSQLDLSYLIACLFHIIDLFLWYHFGGKEFG